MTFRSDAFRSLSSVSSVSRYWLPLPIVYDFSVFNSTSNLDKVTKITLRVI